MNKRRRKSEKLKIKKISNKKIKNSLVTEHNGFIFENVAIYNEISVIDDFYKSIFNKSYQTINTINDITSKENLKDAIKSCSRLDEIDKIYEKNVNAFINKYTSSSEKFVKEFLNENKIFPAHRRSRAARHRFRGGEEHHVGRHGREGRGEGNRGYAQIGWGVTCGPTARAWARRQPYLFEN
jgi:hypothetical protein